ncbi:MAG: hypothetical protein ACFFDN_13515, partial [Candidatus Hodarchaeota archaeon]
MSYLFYLTSLITLKIVMIKNKKNNSSAVVIGLSVNALSIIRSLGRKSIDVIAISSSLSDYAAKSR